MICLLFYSKEERTDRRAHAGNVLDFARIANQGYNGRRSRCSGSMPGGRSDRTYADKRAKFSEEFMSGKYSMRREREEREREAEEFSNTRRRGMSQRLEMGGESTLLCWK